MLLFLLFVFLAGSDATAKFYLLNRRSPSLKTEITNNNLNLIDANKPIKFIIHGWHESSDATWYGDMTEAYLLKYDCNVIQVDWKHDAEQLYTVSVINTRIIGNKVGELIQLLKYKQKLNLKNVHICGHSLGGQVAGFAGKAVQRMTGEKIDRISALDPAGPLFEGNSQNDRLDASDAHFVDATHTDGGVFGYSKPIGTVDFMPNGGKRHQPGCSPLQAIFSNMTPQQKLFCSHTRSYLYFIASISNDNMIATKCDTYDHYLLGDCNNNKRTIYGEDTARNISGVFYFQTTDKAPYTFNP